MNNVVYYNAEDGRITGWGQMTDESVEHSTVPVLVVPVPMPDAEKTHYVKENKLTVRPDSPVVLTGMTLTNVPIGADIYINMDVYQATDSTVELEFAYPGTYNVTVSNFPQREWQQEITV